MQVIEFKGWRLAVDTEATKAAYAEIGAGDATACGCDECQKFMSARLAMLPAAVSMLLEQLGVSAQKEIEPTNFGPDSEGRDIWDWLYFFIGRIESVPDDSKSNGRTDFIPLSEEFEIGFTDEILSLGKQFAKRGPVVEVECFYHGEIAKTA